MKNNGINPHIPAELPAAFAVGAVLMLVFLRVSAWDVGAHWGETSVLLCALIMAEAALLGGSYAGRVLLPLCAALFGGFVCLFSAVQRLSGNGLDIEGVAALAVMTPVFFAAAAAGLRFSSALAKNRGAAGVFAVCGKKYIFLLCVCAALAAAILYRFEI